MLAYHDPELFMHLHKFEFHPNLYVIPWFLTNNDVRFLTMFAHVFSIDVIYPLWDKILLSPPYFPLLVAVGT